MALGVASRWIDTAAGRRPGSGSSSRRGWWGRGWAAPGRRAGWQPGLGCCRRIGAAGGDGGHLPGVGRRRRLRQCCPACLLLAVTAGPVFGAAGAELHRGGRGRLIAAVALGAAFIVEGVLLQSRRRRSRSSAGCIRGRGGGGCGAGGLDRRGQSRPVWSSLRGRRARNRAPGAGNHRSGPGLSGLLNGRGLRLSFARARPAR